MPHQAPLQPGDPRRVGRYRLAGRIAGIPAEGPIYLGTGPDGTEVTISVMHSEWTRDAAARDRFAAEAVVAKRVPPFCAARILDAGLDGSDAFLISEYVPGRSLLEVISTDGTLPGPDLEAAAIGMATGLASVHHAGLVHGNFGPEYVIMTSAGPRVVEFGITPPYGAATPSADMAAWAQTVVFAAAGKPPSTLADLDVLPDYLRTVVADCLSADPAERPAARSAVLELIGDENLPAGVLAEGSRRAVPGAGFRTRQQAPHVPGPGSPWPVAGRPPAGQPATLPPGDRPPSERGTGSRPAVSRHGRADEAQRGAGYPAGPAPDRHGAHQHQHQPSRRRRAVPMIVGIVLVCALLLLGVVHLLQDQGKSGNSAQAGGGHSKATDPASHRASPTEPTARPTPTAATPASFAGEWSGRVKQTPTNFVVTVTLATGTSAGTISYSGTDLNCSGALSLTKVTTKTLTLSQHVTQGPCLSGTVTLTQHSADSVRFIFNGSGPEAEGTLSKS